MRKTAKEIYDSLSKEFIRRGIGSDDFSKLNELYTWAEIGEEAKSEYKKIQDLEVKLSTQWDIGYKYGVKEAGGRIKELEAKLSKAVDLFKSSKLKDYLIYFCKCEDADEIGCWDCKNTGFLTLDKNIISNCIEVKKTIEAIEKGE